LVEKRRSPGKDLLSDLVQVEQDGDRLSDDELATLASLLFAAGFETTTNLFGNGLFALLRNPDQMRLLRDEPSLFANLPEELLRYDGTVQMINRYTESEVDVGGVTIPAGEQVFTLLGSGNHDGAHFPDPDRLDVTREDIRPLTLGGGVHFCLGAALARAEIEITFRTVLGRLDSIELAETPRFQDRLTLRGLESLRITCRPAAGGAAASSDRAPSRPVSARLTAVSPQRGLRPGGDADADLRWRAELREKIETDPGAASSIPRRTGAELRASSSWRSSPPPPTR
jgi:cytochrome P450